MNPDNYRPAYMLSLIGGVILLAAVMLVYCAGLVSLARQNAANIRLNIALAKNDSAALVASAGELAGILTQPTDEQGVWRGIALAHMSHGQLANAADAYRHVDGYQQELRVWGTRAEAQKQWTTAQDWYRVAILLDPENGDHYYRLARVSAELAEPEAGDYYTQALAAAQRTEFGRSNILTRLAEMEKRITPVAWRNVLAQYDQAIQLDEFTDQTDIIQAWLGKAEALERLGQSRAALEAYEWLAARSPGHYWANVHSGRLAWQVDADGSRAVRYLEKAINIDGRPKWAYLYLAQAYVQMGEASLAIPLFREVLERDPDDRSTQEQLKKLENGNGS